MGGEAGEAADRSLWIPRSPPPPPPRPPPPRPLPLPPGSPVSSAAAPSIPPPVLAAAPPPSPPPPTASDPAPARTSSVAFSLSTAPSPSRYLEPLSIALENEKWSLVQPLLSSSYVGYGTSSLEQDSLEIDQLIGYLINKENSEGVVLLGHSTGCQDIVHYMHTNFACSRAVRGVILQAPVSDREYRATLPETAVMIDLAAKMISEGRGMELMPREANPDAPITAYRYHSLCAYMGDDDMFSSDLSEDQLRLRLGHMSSTPCQVIFSMADENVPDYVDKKALVERLCQALGGAEKVEIEWANHSLSNRVQEAVQAILDFVKREGPKGWDDPWN
uniref:UPF0613 protein PB24D3.06c isoform X2 n=1 Tax=Elaeis guineensis var. tenera TaxID=51953 RepID=A0A8N4FAY7_ELAGV|nr:UPF0613 protein PB24D3.06c isoform X2 [Elaeis guineensis]